MPLDPRLFGQYTDYRDSPSMTLDIGSFGGGMVNKIHATGLENDQAVVLQNLLLKQAGLFQVRSGTTNTMNATSPPSGSIIGLGKWNPASATPAPKLIAVGQTGILDWDGSGTWRPLTGGSFSGTEPVYFVQGASFSSAESFTNKGWFFQKGASAVYQYDGSSTLTTVSGGFTGTANSIPKGADALFWNGRLWVMESGVNNGMLRYSEYGIPTVFDLSNGFMVNPADEVVRIVQFFESGILIFMKNSIWVVDIDQSNFESLLFDSTQIKALNYDIGCVAGKSVAQSGQDFFFLSRFGVMQLSKTERDKAIGRAIPISDPIEATIQRINWSYADRATATVWDNVYLLAIPVDGSTRNNLVIAYDIREDAWYEITGWEVGDFCSLRFISTPDRLYFGTSHPTGASKVYWAYSTATSDDGTAFSGIARTPRYDFGTTDIKKIPRYIDVFTDASTGGTVAVYAAPDNQSLQLLETITVEEDQLNLPFDLPPVGNPILGGASLQRNRIYLDRFEAVREIQFEFRCAGTSQTKVLYFSLSAQPCEHVWS